jgi:hypothetical protein
MHSRGKSHHARTAVNPICHRRPPPPPKKTRALALVAHHHHQYKTPSNGDCVFCNTSNACGQMHPDVAWLLGSNGSGLIVCLDREGEGGGFLSGFRKLHNAFFSMNTRRRKTRSDMEKGKNKRACITWAARPNGGGCVCGGGEGGEGRQNFARIHTHTRLGARARAARAKNARGPHARARASPVSGDTVRKIGREEGDIGLCGMCIYVCSAGRCAPLVWRVALGTHRQRQSAGARARARYTHPPQAPNIGCFSLACVCVCVCVCVCARARKRTRAHFKKRVCVKKGCKRKDGGRAERVAGAPLTRPPCCCCRRLSCWREKSESSQFNSRRARRRRAN